MGFDLPPPNPSIELSIASRGYSKGVAQTDGVQAIVRPELAFGSVWIGAYAKNVTSPQFDGEAGALVGYRKTFGKTELSGSAAIKQLIAPAAGVDKTALELVFAVTRAIGDLKPRVRLTYSPDDLGSTGRTAFWEAGGSYQIDKNTSVTAGVGLRRRDGSPDYASFNAGLARTLAGPFTAEVLLYDTNKHRLGDEYRRRMVVSLRARF